MKIYFTGSHSVGKSTLARYVSKQYNLPMISETARMVLSERELKIDTLRHDIDLVDDYQKEVFNRQLLEELKYSEFVSDRSAIDVLAYSAEHSRIFPELLARSDLKQYLSNLKAPDSILFFVRPDAATLQADGVREALNWDSCVAIDAQIKMLLEMFEIRYYQINVINMQQRIRLIDNILNLCKA